MNGESFSNNPLNLNAIVAEIKSEIEQNLNLNSWLEGESKYKQIIESTSQKFQELLNLLRDNESTSFYKDMIFQIYGLFSHLVERVEALPWVILVFSSKACIDLYNYHMPIYEADTYQETQVKFKFKPLIFSKFFKGLSSVRSLTLDQLSILIYSAEGIYFELGHNNEFDKIFINNLANLLTNLIKNLASYSEAQHFFTHTLVINIINTIELGINSDSFIEAKKILGSAILNLLDKFGNLGDWLISDSNSIFFYLGVFQDINRIIPDEAFTLPFFDIFNNNLNIKSRSSAQNISEAILRSLESDLRNLDIDPHKCMNEPRENVILLAKAQYRKLQKRWHPDKNRQNIEEANTKSKLINAAYSNVKQILDFN
jgi:hypothetical protein